MATATHSCCASTPSSPNTKPATACCVSHSDELPSANALSALRHHLSGTLSPSPFRTVTRLHYLNLDLKHICSPSSMLRNCPVRQRLWSHGNMALYKFCIVMRLPAVNGIAAWKRTEYWEISTSACRYIPLLEVLRLARWRPIAGCCCLAVEFVALRPTERCHGASFPASCSRQFEDSWKMLEGNIFDPHRACGSYVGRCHVTKNSSQWKEHVLISSNLWYDNKEQICKVKTLSLMELKCRDWSRQLIHVLLAPLTRAPFNRHFIGECLQCFDAVGWAAWRAPGL